MTVVQAVQEFALNPLNIGDDLGRPLGMWEGIGVAIGDATGSSVEFNLGLSNRFLWSYEAFSANVTLPSTTTFATTWQPSITPLGVAWRVGADGSDGVLTRQTRVFEQLLRFPISGLNAKENGINISVSITANVDLEIYRVNMWGYYWDKRAIRFPGGLIRPAF